MSSESHRPPSTFELSNIVHKFTAVGSMAIDGIMSVRQMARDVTERYPRMVTVAGVALVGFGVYKAYTEGVHAVSPFFDQAGTAVNAALLGEKAAEATEMPSLLPATPWLSLLPVGAGAAIAGCRTYQSKPPVETESRQPEYEQWHETTFNKAYPIRSIDILTAWGLKACKAWGSARIRDIRHWYQDRQAKIQQQRDNQTYNPFQKADNTI